MQHLHHLHVLHVLPLLRAIYLFHEGEHHGLEVLLSHVHAVPLAFSTLAKRSAQPCQPPTMRTYVRRMRNLLRDVRGCVPL